MGRGNERKEAMWCGNCSWDLAGFYHDNEGGTTSRLTAPLDPRIITVGRNLYVR